MPPETADPPPAAASPATEGQKPAPAKTPIPGPLPSASIPTRPELSAEEQKKYDWLLEQCRAFTTVDCRHHGHNHKANKEDKSGPITDSERLWLTRECLLRYLRATKWHEKDSERRLLETLAWRREFGVEALTPDYISPENETGKQLIMGYDREGRPCHYLNPARQNTEASHRQVEHLVFMLERVIDIMPAGQETLSLQINFKQSKERKNTAPGIAMAREVLHILQMHYPERLGRSLIVNVPWIVWGFFKIITPFIDPHTRDKLKFNEDMTQYVPAEHLWSEYQSQGKQDFEYDHAVYWPALNKLCDERREAREKRWEAAGKVVGESEDYLAGRTDVSVGAVDAKPDVVQNGETAKAVEKPEDLSLEAMNIEEKKVVANGEKNNREKTEEKAAEEVKAS